MPKLNATLAKQVDETEVSDFSALPEGTYTVKLLEVEAKEGRTSGKPYWLWTFEIDEEAHPDAAGRRLWVNTSLSEKASFKMKEAFLAFGYSTDSDTDEMIGEKIKVVVTQTVIEQGKRKGQIGNQVDQMLPLVAAADTTTSGAGSDDDLFEE